MIAMAISLIVAFLLLVFVLSPNPVEIGRWPEALPTSLAVSFDGHGLTIG